MVSSLQLQLYQHNYGLVCMTGLLGCRWHRYKQSTQPNRKRDIAWNLALLLTSFIVIALFYFLLVAISDEDELNWFLYIQTENNWVPWFTYVLAVISTIFAYIVILLLLSLCHIIQGHQVYIHPVHLVFILLILATCCVLVWAIEEYWHSEWTVLYLSLLIIGPFLQLGAVVIMTLLTWIVAHQYYKIKHTVSQILCVCTYLAVMIGLYISPLFIKSPCVIEAENIPNKPKIFAQKGAPVVAPENTVISFKIAIDNHVYGLATDVRISFDGVPFLLHDSSLHRTTNINSVFPDLVYKDPSYFNISQLKMLSAGEWFIESDPRHSVGSLSVHERLVYRNQSIPTLAELLQLAKLHSRALMFDIKIPPAPHPYYNTTAEQVFKVIKNSGISGHQIWYSSGGKQRVPAEFKHLSQDKLSVKDLQARNMTGLKLKHNQITLSEIDNYSQKNMTVSIYSVNSAWLFSLYWCVGVDSVLTDYCHILTKQESPIWHLSPQNYQLLWISVDSVSFLLVCVIFIVQRIRFMGKRYIPEQVSLNSHSSGNPLSRNYHSRRSMKEKLIINDVHSDIFDYDDEPDEIMGFESGGYDATINATDGRILAQSFHGNGYSYQTEAQIS